ncbi:hypothetical protein [Phyllobacterium sp. OV277]|nr:hypothetical protein [Phyllobacterium sp. OV277]
MAQRISNRMAVPNGISKSPAEEFCNETLLAMNPAMFRYKNTPISKFLK